MEQRRGDPQDPGLHVHRQAGPGEGPAGALCEGHVPGLCQELQVYLAGHSPEHQLHEEESGGADGPGPQPGVLPGLRLHPPAGHPPQERDHLQRQAGVSAGRLQLAVCTQLGAVGVSGGAQWV